MTRRLELRRIIKGHIYDTSTATLIAEDTLRPHFDTQAYIEQLYKTAKGNYFLAGEGGAETRWSQPAGGGFQGGGCGIIPLSAEDALAWMQDHNVDAAIIEAEFGSMLKEA